MLTDTTLKSKIDSLWDKFWSGGNAHSISIIDQIHILIFK